MNERRKKGRNERKRERKNDRRKETGMKVEKERIKR